MRQDGPEWRDDLGFAARRSAVSPRHVRRLLGPGAGAGNAPQPPPATGMERPKYEFGRENRVLRPIIAAQEVQKSLAVIIASGVLERFPTLNVISAEYGVGWVPFWLGQVDNTVGRGSSRRGGFATSLSMKPTEYFARQVYVTYIDDEVGIQYRGDIGVDRVMWSSDIHTQRQRGRSPASSSSAISPAPGRRRTCGRSCTTTASRSTAFRATCPRRPASDHGSVFPHRPLLPYPAMVVCRVRVI